MALASAVVVTTWNADAPVRHPALTDSYPALAYYEDITGQFSENIPPQPNAYIVVVVDDETVIAQIDGDPEFLVLTIEAVPEQPAPSNIRHPDTKPTNAEKNKARAWLELHGYTVADVTAFFGTNRNRREIMNALLERMRQAVRALGG